MDPELEAIFSKPKQEIVEPPTATAPAKPTRWVWLVAVGLLFGGIAIGRYGSCVPFHQGGHQEQIDTNGTTIVFVHEKQSATAEQVKFIDSLEGIVSSQGYAGYLSLDEEDATNYIEQAAKQNISSPFIAWVKDGKIIKFAAWSPEVLK